MRTLLVTGANSEIGSTFINEAASEYDCIIAHYGHRHERIDSLVGKYGEKIVPICADLSNSGDLEKLTEELTKYQIDEFLHVAAPKFRHLRFTKGDIKEFELEMQVCFWSFLRICQHIIPGMVKRKQGRIVSILTEYTITHQPSYMAHYISAKYALLGLIKSLASEYAAKNIKVNALSPAMIETEFVSQMPQYVIDDAAKASINGKNLTVIELVPSIQYLLSKELSAINGQNLLLQ